MLTAERETAEFFDAALSARGGGPEAAKRIANLMNGEVARLANESGGARRAGKLTPAALAGVVRLADEGVIGGPGVRQVIEELFRDGGDPAAVVAARGLAQVSDESAVEAAVDAVIAASPAEVERYRAGNQKLIGFLVGQVMKAMKGKGNPAVVNAVLKRKLRRAVADGLGGMGRRAGRRGIGGRTGPGVPPRAARPLGGGGRGAGPGRALGRGGRGRGGRAVLRPARLGAPGRPEGRPLVTEREALRPVGYDDRKDEVRLLDQRLLPGEETWLALASADEVADAIRTLAVRGAPAIGVAAAYGLAVEARRGATPDRLREAAELLARARPTAVNLEWAVRRMARRIGEPAAAMLAEAHAIRDEDEASCRRIGELGAPLLPPAARVLTHCNAGALATAAYGTALGIVRAAREAGRLEHVFADETRPFFQGARLTAWELQRDGIPVTVLTDGMAGWLMARGEISCVVVGADRIAGNGDVANKIGTYGLAVLARHHAIPFYVAAPWSTFDPGLPTGAGIPIEERDSDEVVRIFGRLIAPEGVPARYPAFDVTPADLVTAIVCERGVLRAPYGPAIRALAG